MDWHKSHGLTGHVTVRLFIAASQGGVQEGRQHPQDQDGDQATPTPAPGCYDWTAKPPAVTAVRGAVEPAKGVYCWSGPGQRGSRPGASTNILVNGLYPMEPGMYRS